LKVGNYSQIFVLFLGHTDLILGVDSAQWDGGLLASCSKDNSCLLWRVTKTDLNESALTVEQVGIATGHTNSVSAVCFSKHRENSFFVTVSKDQTLKLWNLKQLLMKVDGESEQK
jgi:WD40 repeat protein